MFLSLLVFGTSLPFGLAACSPKLPVSTPKNPEPAAALLQNDQAPVIILLYTIDFNIE